MKTQSALILVSLATPALSEDRVTLSGTSRLRYEAIEGQPRPQFNDTDELINLRTTLALDYHSGPLRLFGELYDSRVTQARRGTPVTTNEVNVLEPVQAYVAYDAGELLGRGSKTSIQAGRFLLNLGSRRLVAADDYRNTTNSYTGVKFDFAMSGGIDATLIYTLPQLRLPDGFDALVGGKAALDRESFDLVLWGGQIAKKDAIGATKAELSFFHLGERDAPLRPTRDRSLDTVGGRLIREPKAGQWDHEAELFYQFGSVRSGLAGNAALLDVSAWFLHMDGGYTFARGWKPRISLEFDYATGQGRGPSATRFDTLFGMRRGDLAPAGLYNAIGRANILTPAIRIEVTPSTRLDWFANYRAMWLASRTDAFSTTGVRDASGASSNFAGHQLEARVRYWAIPKRLRLEANALLLVKGQFMKTAPNAARNGHTKYLSVNATASF